MVAGGFCWGLVIDLELMIRFLLVYLVVPFFTNMKEIRVQYTDRFEPTKSTKSRRQVGNSRESVG